MRSREATGFVLMGEGGCLMIEVLGYENPRPQTASDANWLQTRVRLDAGGCALLVERALTTQDMKYFLEDLESVVSAFDGSASLTTDEGWISVQVTISKSGTANVTGELLQLGIAQIKLGFAFQSDQSFIVRTISELRDLVNKFPVVDSS